MNDSQNVLIHYEKRKNKVDFSENQGAPLTLSLTRKNLLTIFFFSLFIIEAD